MSALSSKSTIAMATAAEAEQGAGACGAHASRFAAQSPKPTCAGLAVIVVRFRQRSGFYLRAANTRRR